MFLSIKFMKYLLNKTRNEPNKINDIEFSRERIGKSKTYTYYIETPITLDFLIQLKEANEFDNIENTFYNKIKRPDDVNKIDSLINELLVEGHKYAGQTQKEFTEYQKQFKAYQDTLKLLNKSSGKMDLSTLSTLNEDDENKMQEGGKKKRVTRKKIQVKRKQRNTLRKSTIKPINKKTRGRRNKKKKRSVTFKL